MGKFDRVIIIDISPSSEDYRGPSTSLLSSRVWLGPQKRTSKIIFIEAPITPFGNMVVLMPLKPLGWIGETRMKREDNGEIPTTNCL